MIRWILAVVAVEAIVEILIHGRPFEWLRKIMEKREFTKELISCGWCTSCYVAVFVCVIILLHYEILLVPFAIQRASNLFHFLFGILRELRWKKW